MSVIAFRDGVVAADTRAGFGNGWISPERAQKIWTTPHGIAGIVGAWAPVDAIREWTFTNLKKPPPKVGEDTTIIEVHRGSVVFVTEKDWRFCQTVGPQGFFAWGSGRIPAMAAFYMQADARRAVEIAMLMDNDCGGDVVALSLEEDDDGRK